MMDLRKFDRGGTKLTRITSETNGKDKKEYETSVVKRLICRSCGRRVVDAWGRGFGISLN